MKGRAILVVEDEEQVRTLIVRVLEKRGFSVFQAENGRKALEVADTRLGEIALVITDIVMPEMGGAPLLKELRALRPELPFLCMTGYTKEEVISSGSLPDAHFIEKPFTPNALVSEVEAILAQRGSQ